MNDFNKPIRPVKGTQRSYLKKDVNFTNSKHQTSHQKNGNFKENRKSKFMYTLKCIKDFFTRLVSLTKKHESLELLSGKNVLIKLKKQLLNIGDNERLNHQEFALEFSSCWKDLLEVLQQHPISKGQLLIDSFKTFPGRNTYSLHFYLTRFSGKEWFPLPFFELLKSLHEEYRRNKKNSQIDRWIHLIDEIISSSSMIDEGF